MLTQLTTIKSRLALTDTLFDALLTGAIDAVSARFDRECRRTFARTENATHEFDAADTEILPACYPIESVAKFELKTSEANGWQEQPDVQYLVRSASIISLPSPLALLTFSLARMTYTGGYVLPGGTPGPGQTPLPADLEQAAVEQVAYWFQNRDRLGLLRVWDYHSTYRHFADLDLLSSVQGVLKTYRRFAF